VFTRETQNEPDGQSAAYINNHWRPVPILWLKEVRFKVLNIQQAGFGGGASPLPSQSGERCDKEFRSKLPGRMTLQSFFRSHGRQRNPGPECSTSVFVGLQ
jgi:hypothetical protein